MKTAYKQWNRDHYINDESVLEDIKIMTKGKLSLSEDASFDYLKNTGGRNDKKRKHNNNNRNNYKKNNKHKQYKKRKSSY